MEAWVALAIIVVLGVIVFMCFFNAAADLLGTILDACDD